jgi:hypothetical protein
MSALEEIMAKQFDAAGIAYEREYKILEGRKFRADFKAWNGPDNIREGVGSPWVDFEVDLLTGEPGDPADWPAASPHVILIEVNGQGPHGRHGSYGHAESDAEKLSAIACLGYRCLTVTGKQVRSGEALWWIRCALGIEGKPEDVFAKRRSPRILRSHRASRGARGLPARVRKAAGLA